MTKMVQGAGVPAGSVDYMKYEFVTAQKAEHAPRGSKASAELIELWVLKIRSEDPQRLKFIEENALDVRNLDA